MDHTSNLPLGPAPEPAGDGAPLTASSDALVTLSIASPSWQPGPDAPPVPTLTDPLVRAEARWLQTEKARLKSYLLELQAGLQQSQAAAINHRHRWEQQRVQNLQDLDAQRTALEAKRRALDEREAELAQRRAELESRYEPLLAAQKLLSHRQGQAAELEQAVARGRQEVEELRLRIAREEAELRAARQQLANLDEEAAAQRITLGAEQESLAEQRQQIEGRYAEHEQAETALQQRMHDWEEHESQTRRAFDKQQEQHALLRPLVLALEANPELRGLVTSWDRVPEHARRTIQILLSAS